MRTNKNTVTAVTLILLMGCQTSPSVTTTDTRDCPAMEAVSCPVCEEAQCPEPEVPEKVITQCEPTPASQCEPAYPVVGEKEWALVEPGNLVLEARIDTGAETSSIHAEDIQLIEKDGKRWVRFNLPDPKTNTMIPLERRLHRRILVKQQAEEVEDRRYVVRMWVTLGETRTWLDVSLSDRTDFEFPLLIGRNMLMDAFVVDVSRHHSLPVPVPPTEGQ